MNSKRLATSTVVVFMTNVLFFIAIFTFTSIPTSANQPELEPEIYFSTPTPQPERKPSELKLLPADVITPTTAQDLVLAMGIKVSDLVSATLNGSDVRGVGIATNPIGSHFPTQGNTFAILSTGLAESAEWANDDSGLSFVLDGLDNSQFNDLVQLAMQLKVPQNMNCASFDFSFSSDEFPEFVGSSFNDTFTAEIGGTNLVISGTQVLAPHNFAFDTEDNIISVNTIFTYTLNTTTSPPTYDGTTSLLRAQTVVTPNATIDIVFSVQDLGDSVFDSAVFLDKFFWSNDTYCGSGAQQDSDGDGLLDIWFMKAIRPSRQWLA